MIALQCKHVRKRFGAVAAVDDASLTVNAGEIRGILGGNGSGKSTLAKILAGSVRPDGGEFELEGEAFRPASPRDSHGRRVIATSQELSLFDNLSVEDNLLLSALPRKGGLFVDREALRKEAILALRCLGIEEVLDRKVGTLSPDQKYLLEAAKALAQDPRVLVIDEITSALYREQTEKVRRVLRVRADSGCAVLFITHRLPEIQEICDSVTIMRNGRTVGTFGSCEKNENELLAAMSGVDVAELVRVRTPLSQPAPGTRSEVVGLSGYVIPGFKERVELSVSEGEIVGVAGLQGQGQSALVRSLLGVKRPARYRLLGTDRTIASPQDAVRCGVAFLSGDREQEGIFRARSILENVGVVAELVQRKRVDKLAMLGKYNVKSDRATRPIVTLSGGNQQKVVISRWISIEPRLLLADDPTKGIDVGSRREIRRYLHELARAGTAVILVSSDDEELVELTKAFDPARVVVMYDGQIVHTLRGGDISTENIALHAIPRKARP